MTETSEPARSSGESVTWADPADLGDVESKLADADGLVVGLDFDGTLAPIAENPDAVSIQPAARRAVAALATRSDAKVAVISGRALDDLYPAVGVSRVVYVGNHGLEMDRDGRRSVHPEAEALRPAVERACDAVEARVGHVPGCLVERKGPTATVHYRRTPPDRVPAVRDAVEAATAGEADLRLVGARQAIEIRPSVDWDKGAAMRRVVEDAPGGWAAVYAGDDATDEDVFAALGPDDVGVRVGDDADTAAEFSLPDQESVAPFLAWLDEAVLGEAPRRA